MHDCYVFCYNSYLTCFLLCIVILGVFINVKDVLKNFSHFFGQAIKDAILLELLCGDNFKKDNQ